MFRIWNVRLRVLMFSPTWQWRLMKDEGHCLVVLCSLSGHLNCFESLYTQTWIVKQCIYKKLEFCLIWSVIDRFIE